MFIMSNDSFSEIVGLTNFKFLQYADSEKDLGVDITSNFSYNVHCDGIISRANQKFGMLTRTCNFINDVKRRIILDLTLIWS